MMKVTSENKNKSESESKYIVGAILAYKKTGNSENVRVKIQWDAELNTGSFNVRSQGSLNNQQLLLFDTGLKTETECIRCSINIKGIIWKNENNQAFCTMCYMRFADEFIGKFTWECGKTFCKELSRKEAPNKWTDVLLFVENESVKYQTIETKKTCLSVCGFRKASGIVKNDKLMGKLTRDSILHPMTVQSINGSIFMRDICDLKIQIGIEKNKDCHFYYQDHLQLLGEDETEFYDAQVKHFDKNQEQVSKIQVQVWKKEASVSWENSYRPVLHFIFVDQKDDILQDVLNLLSHSRISCHLVYDQVVLWHNRQENIQSCGVHENTRKETITKLLDNNFRMFKVMKEESSINKDERKVKGKKKRKGLLQRNRNCSNIGYFIDIAERFFGEKVMPVIVTSYAIEEMEKCIQDKANEAEIPILSFEDSSYVSVLWSSESCMKKGSKVKEESSKRATNLNTDCCFPRGCFCKNMSSVSPNNNSKTDEDLRVTEASESNMNMSQPITSKDKKLKLENKYEVDRTKPWIVREWQKDQALETDIDNQRCLISKAINKDFVRLVASTIVGVVIHKLKSLRRRSQTVPAREMLLYVRSLSCQLLKDGQWMFPGEYISTLKTLDDIFNQKSIEYIYEKNMKNEFKSGLWEELRTATKSTYRPPKITEDSQLILTKDCAGVDLVFFALLKKKRLDGGTQLIEKGCVGVRSILIGAKILVKHTEEWRISETEKKDFEDLAIKFSQHAFSIMNYIQEKDELERLRSPKGWVNNIKHFFIKEDEVSGKAGRLLLNHGYLDVAYKTKNECFLENPKLKTMIKELWYGDEYQSRRKIDTILRLFLCIMHVFIMPIMLFTLDKPSWIYKKYHTPILKLWINTAGLMSFLAAFAYMLLFDYKENGVSQSEFAVLFWILNKSVDEFHQICVAVYRDTKRKREKSFLLEYGQDMWNRLDLIIILTSFLGFIVKLLFEDDFLQGFAKIMFLISYIMLNIRVLNMFWTSEFLGSQLVIIQKKIKITSAFMTIMIVIMMCYNVVDYALLYPNTEFTWTEIENIVRNGYWTLYGDFQEDVGNDCTDNATLYSQGIQQRCPSFLGALLSPYLRAIYCLIAILMLLNMLIAIYTKTSDSVHDKSRIYWSQLQSNFLEEYKIRTIFPVHFKICCLGALVFHLLIYIVMKMYGIQREEQALFIKVLVFDDNFDVDPQKETPEEMAEKNGILEMQGERENEDFEEKSIEQNIISGQSDTEEDGHQINCKPPDEEVDKKINKIIQELNEVKRVWENKDIRERKTNSF
ncbi:uncharacterized protein LOC134259647 isoform X2 [Saccostrea cucullata]|uniref:uncharacterized protein LOC134259647 isoform X2 n=1 Tax=Saccostrea cuccullata TaxID=36930 RepID=UPI002ED1EFA1